MFFFVYWFFGISQSLHYSKCMVTKQADWLDPPEAHLSLQVLHLLADRGLPPHLALQLRDDERPALEAKHTRLG